MPRPVQKILVVLVVLSVALTAFFYMGVRERDRYLGDLIDAALVEVDLESPTEVAMALSSEIYDRTFATLEREDLSTYDRLESLSPFNVTTAVALKYGGFGIAEHDVLGPCGTMTRTLLNALWTLDIPARKLQLLPNEHGEGGGHTMVEYYDGGRWRVLSPSDSTFVWRLDDGSVATRSDIRAMPAVYRQIFSRYPEYPFRFDNPSNIRWEKLPGPVQNAFRVVLGEQGFRAAQTPRLYDRPRDLFMIAFASLSAILLLALLLWRPRSRRSGGAARALGLIPA